MKFAIIADLHANLEALQAVLADAKEQGCTHHAFLGDMVGYCADPKACVDIIRAMSAPCVMGNHDEYCGINRVPHDLNARVLKTIDWTCNQLSSEDKHWL